MLFQPILALDMIVFEVGKIIGGGGGQIDMFAPPPIFSLGGGGGDCPPGSTPLPRGGGGCSPSHGRELFHFSTCKCAIWGIPKKQIST